MQQSSSYSVLSVGVVVVTVLSVTLLAQDAESAAIVDHNSEHFKVQQQSCSDLCGFCPSCNGFYCGEECICECRQAADDHVECISKIKENSDKLGLIYDVLIQLPKSNNAGGNNGGTLTTRFARSAAPGKHGHHHDMGHDEMATFRKVVFSNFGPTRPGSNVANTTTTTDDAPLTGTGSDRADGAAVQSATTDHESGTRSTAERTTPSSRSPSAVVAARTGLAKLGGKW